jgi:hypothetical protein
MKSKVLRLEEIEPEETFDITVADHHNFFAAKTGKPVLVHNCKEFIVDYVVGPIRHVAKMETMQPNLIVHKSAMNRKVQAKQWTSIVKALYRDEARNKDIIDKVMKDLKDGHSILIPATQRWFIQAMVEEINKRWAKTGASEPIAAPFYRMGKKQDKLDVLNAAREGKIRVVVAMRSMLTGVNVPRWSAIYELSPINNKPNLEQETKRICTPYEGKKPIIRWFVDYKCSVSARCFISCVEHMKSFDYRIDDSAKKMIADVRNNVLVQPDYSYGNKVNIGMPGSRISL